MSEIKMKRTFTILLPVIMGALSVGLMIWDSQNQRVIRSMGMAWDTGAPLWPYQTPDTLLFALNTPAYLLAAPATHWTIGIIGPLRYITLLPAILLWWWIVGMFFDGWRSRIGDRTGWFWTSLLLLIGVVLILLGVSGLPPALRWWWTYCQRLFDIRNLIMMRILAPSIWSFVLGAVALELGKRRILKNRHARSTFPSLRSE